MSAPAASQNWTLIGTTTLSERQHSNIAYDEATSQLVVFGGDNTVNVVNDTWLFTGTRWKRLQPPQSPPARTSASMVYFPVTGAVILFGGDTHTAPNGLLNDTWSFDGTTWTQLQTAHQPPPRYDAAMAYDPVNHEIVLYGGFADQLGFVSDTWTFDGTDWTDRSSNNDPPPRYGAAMAFDSKSDSVILFGGLGFTQAGTSAFLNDTWAWRNHQWTKLNPPTSPPGRWEPAMAENISGGVTIFGGYADSGIPHGPSSQFSDTWNWDGTTWTQSTATGPGGRYGTAMTKDAALNALALVGGCCNSVGGFYTDTWTFDGNAWTRHDRPDAPSVRDGAAMISDVDRGDIVLFGGFGGDGFLSETWIENNGQWSHLSTTTAPPGRFAANLAYDQQNHVAVLFGGQSGPNSGCSLYPDDLNLNHFCDDTWTFDGQNWTRRAITVASPPFRSLAAMAYDGDTQQTVLFGGHSGQDTISDTWTWDGLTWTQQSPSKSPPGEPGSSPGLESAMMAWDPIHHQLILFGGEGNGPTGPQYFNETWIWTGSDWQQLQPLTSPPARKAAILTFDPMLGGLVLSSGQGSGPGTFGTYSDTWLWDGADWTQLLPTTIPPPRYFASGGYDSTIKSILLFGGGGDDGYLDDTWTLRRVVQLMSIVSRKAHGSAGTFDIDLTNGNGIECRSGGANGAYTIVFSFANTLTSVASASVTSGTGSIASNNIDSSDARNYLVNLTGVTNAQRIAVTLTNVTDSVGDFSNAVSAQMGLLLGDVNASGLVDGNDVSAVQSHTRQSVDSTNFRYDVNASGVIDGNDVSVTQGHTRTSLP